MSRRRGEFEHRTSIFEGAFRAWSHLGGLEPNDLESLSVEQLDPLQFVIEGDPRLIELEREAKKQKTDGEAKEEDENRRLYPYEPLPRSGLAHPFVQAILSPWLGPDAEQDAIQLGLTTLRTWWQHRRKGESGSAVVALGTQKMRGVVDGYTRHFFNLALCLVMKDGEQPPRTLMGKMKEVEKVKNKKVKKRAREEETGKLTALALNAGLDHGIDPPPQACMPSLSPTEPIINMSQQCIPGKVDLPGVLQQISNANQLVHRGNVTPLTTLSTSIASEVLTSQPTYDDIGDPNTFPVVFLSESGDVLLLMTIEGITCAHCIKIVETVLKGCETTKSPIPGLEDATADQSLKTLLLKIDTTLNAKRIAYEATRNLSMVGYTAKPLEINFLEFQNNKQFKVDGQMICTAFEVVSSADPLTFFDWEMSCRCSPLGIEKDLCPRHCQMNSSIGEAFRKRKDQITLFMNNCTGENVEAAPINEPQSSSGGGMSFLRRNSRLRQSVTSEAGFGRAMSGLSALSIDWENMEDFDVNIDHSSHINNTNLSEPIKKNECCEEKEGIAQGCAMQRGGECDCGPTCECVGCPVHGKGDENVLRSFPKRPSILRKGGENESNGNGLPQVSFKT